MTDIRLRQVLRQDSIIKCRKTSSLANCQAKLYAQSHGLATWKRQ